MKIGLVSSLMKDNDITHQVAQMKTYLSANNGCDLLCFGESFLQGFEGLTWEYEEDKKRALSQDDKIIDYIRGLAKKYRCGISFGFIEKYKEALFSSNMVISSQGEIIDVFRRVSEGWKEPVANSMYQEGEGFHTFELMNKKFGVAICGDLWHDNLLNDLNKLEMDILLWPLYVDFSIDQWNEKFCDEYIERAGKLFIPTLMINSFVADSDRANGGCYVFKDNKVVSSLPMGNKGVLVFDV